ncbi:unnamed protein product [Anisakis simplex]|uniref:Glutamate receptor n=1 Tax=Anisakis simplex TaxID=6269 RepID=A0A0M3JQW2_ANISI|nr:unnamed protein product [Anisakis simplex]
MFDHFELTIDLTNRICEQLTERCVAIFGPKHYPANVIASSYTNHLSVPHFHIGPRSAIRIPSSDIDRFLFEIRIQCEIKNQNVAHYAHSKSLENIINFCRSVDLFPPPRTISDVLLGVVHYYKWTSMVLLYGHPSGIFDTMTLDLSEERIAECNITAFSFVHPSTATEALRNALIEHHFPVPASSVHMKLAVWSDSLLLLAESIKSTNELILNKDVFSCDKSWQYGAQLTERIINSYSKGITGSIALDRSGKRANSSIIVMKRSKSGFEELGQWQSANAEFVLAVASQNETKKKESLENKTLKITVYLVYILFDVFVEEPFVMLKKLEKGEQLNGNDQYEGYCIDLLQKIAEIRKFKYILHEVKDKSYGSKEANGKWNGMVGELQRGDADLAVASLTISYSRSEVIDFTVPYMHLGISILFKKPETTDPSFFAFMSPLSVDVWVSMLAAYVVTSLAIWLLAAISPYERLDSNRDRSLVILPKQFTFLNSFWFTVSSLMQQSRITVNSHLSLQGSDLSPRAASTRIAAVIWWFFTLIIISSYTANLAAFLTAQRMVSPIESADDLAKQTKIKYGTLGRGSTMIFFSVLFTESKIDTYERMWKLMSSQPNLLVNSSKEGIWRVKTSDYAYLMESSMLEYAVERDCDLVQIGGLIDQKGYGIGLPKGSPYRELISTTILQLQEKTVLTEMKDRWWKRKRGGGYCDASTTIGTDLGTVSLYGIFIILVRYTHFFHLEKLIGQVHVPE